MDELDNITMIKLNGLYHHPDNPRKDLGDLTELAESIRKNGVMQNLTVIQGHWRSKKEFADDCRKEGVAKDSALGMYDRDNSWTRTGFTVVIGNRRMEAARMAGLEAVPCVIVGMDYKTQISTMLEENMQRSDLTIYEQAQGFQMMMDLGMTEEQISNATGFSRTTVKRRVKMAELDQDILQKVGAQLTMDDLDQLAKIRDLDKRNELLKEAGTQNYKWKIGNAIAEQKREDNYQQIRAILLQAGCIEKDTNGMSDFWKEYEYLPYPTRINLDTYEAGQNVLPEDDRQLYFYKEWSCVRFWAEKTKADEQEEKEPTEEEIEKQKKLDEAQAAWTKLEEIENHARESRDSFIVDLTVKQKDNRKAPGVDDPGDDGDQQRGRLDEQPSAGLRGRGSGAAAGRAHGDRPGPALHSDGNRGGAFPVRRDDGGAVLRRGGQHPEPVEPGRKAEILPEPGDDHRVRVAGGLRVPGERR